MTLDDPLCLAIISISCFVAAAMFLTKLLTTLFDKD